MGLFDYFKNPPSKRYAIPFGIKPKDYAQSLLDRVEYHCEEVNKSTTVFDFCYSYERLVELTDELIWLNEKKHVLMTPSPRLSWLKIQQNIPQAINNFIDRALRKYPHTRDARADAIEELLEDISRSQCFQDILAKDNKEKLEALHNEAKHIRNLIQEKAITQIKNSSLHDSLGYYGGPDTALLNIDLMEGHEFEFWCADALRKLGYRNVEVTPGSGDQGVDVLAQKDGIKYAIQCKRYNSDLGNKPIQEVHAGKALYHCHVGVVITNQHFTTGAKEIAAATDTLLWDREWIRRYLVSQSHRVPPISIQTPSNDPLMDDELFSAAVEIVLESGQASVSMLQRRMGLGYAQAARLIDLMESHGVVGPFSGSKPRDILMTESQWKSICKK